MKIKTIITILGALVALTSCNKNPYHRNVSDITVDVSIAPFYLDVQNLGKNPTPQNLEKMQHTYGTFFDIFLADLQKNSMISMASRLQRGRTGVHSTKIKKKRRAHAAITGGNLK